MADLTCFDQHNMVAYLERRDGNAEFYQIADFITTIPINYALTVSPTIYASYIEKFWATAKSKTVNDVKQIHAIVDSKTVVISESSVRSDLHFNDEDGITCLSSENLALMGNLDPTSKKFLMYPRFLQLFLINQIDLAEPFNDVYITPIHTKKVFTNINRQNKDFSKTVTSLFASILVPQLVDGEGSRQPCEPQPPSSTAPPSYEEQVTTVASQHQNTHTPRRTKRGEDDRVVRAATTTTSLEAEQESGNINKTRSMTTLNESSPQGTGLGSGPRCQDTTLMDADAQTRFETASKHSHDPPLLDFNTSGSGEDSMEHQDDLTDFVPPTPYDSPLSGGHTPGSDEGMNLFNIGTSKRQSLDKKNVFKQGRNLKTMLMFKEGDIDDNRDDTGDMVDKAMENIEGDTVNATGAVNTATTRVSATSASVTIAGVSMSTTKPRTPPITITTVFEDDDLTIAQTLVKMRSEKAVEKGFAFRDVEESARPTKILPTIN
uniref:Xylulose kinase-1 n=1 Tax=Tanacetum cinerariifolium TaxID=118510 RepID=A0A699HR21_TANCI|nr:xylulose kinase-1 [Tanacetum cinerariifolium]